MKADVAHVFADSADLQFSITRNRNTTKVINFKISAQSRKDSNCTCMLQKSFSSPSGQEIITHPSYCLLSSKITRMWQFSPFQVKLIMLLCWLISRASAGQGKMSCFWIQNLQTFFSRMAFSAYYIAIKLSVTVIIIYHNNYFTTDISLHFVYQLLTLRCLELMNIYFFLPALFHSKQIFSKNVTHSLLRRYMYSFKTSKPSKSVHPKISKALCGIIQVFFIML